jgi:hypothetical protein
VSLFYLVFVSLFFRFAASTAVWSCAWNSQDKDTFYGGLRNGQVLTFDLRQPGAPLETYTPPGFAPGIHSLCFVPHAVLRYAKDCESSSSSQSSQPPSPLTSRILAANSHGVHMCCNSSLSLMHELKGGCSNLVFDSQSNLFSATFRIHSSYRKTSHKIFQLWTNGGGGYDSLTSREHRTIFCTYTVNSPTSRSCLFTTFETVDVRRKVSGKTCQPFSSLPFFFVRSTRHTSFFFSCRRYWLQWMRYGTQLSFGMWSPV